MKEWSELSRLLSFIAKYQRTIVWLLLNLVCRGRHNGQMSGTAHFRMCPMYDHLHLLHSNSWQIVYSAYEFYLVPDRTMRATCGLPMQEISSSWFKRRKKQCSDDQMALSVLWRSFNCACKNALRSLLSQITSKTVFLACKIWTFLHSFSYLKLASALLIICAVATLQHCLIYFFHFLTKMFTKLLTKQRKQGRIKFKLAHILMLTLVLCTQLLFYASGVLATVNNSAKNTINSTARATSCMAIALVTVCSFPLAEAYSIEQSPSLNSQLHIRDSSPSSPMLTLRLTGGPNVGYCLTVALGSHPEELCVLVDTGSANFAVAGNRQDGIDEWFHNTSSTTFQSLERTISVSYTSGEWTGTLAKDSISLGNRLSTEIYFAVIESSTNFFIDQATWVGILGLGYASLAKPDSSLPTFWDSIQSDMKDVFSLQLCPPVDVLVTGGTALQGGWIVLGGVNESLYEGDIFSTSIAQEKFYNIIITNLTVGSTIINMDCKEFNNDKAIIDSGTTDLFLPTHVYQKVEMAFKEHFMDGIPLDVPQTFWDGESKLMWQAQEKDEIYSSFPTFHIGFSCDANSSEGFSLALAPQTYLRQISGSDAEMAATNITCSPCDFFTFGIKPRDRGTVIGSNMMLGFYTIFDRENKKMSFAPNKCSYHNDNVSMPYIEGPYTREPLDCQYRPPGDKFKIISYLCATITVIMALLTVSLLVINMCRQKLSSNCSRRICHCFCCCCFQSYKKLESSNSLSSVLLGNEDSQQTSTATCTSTTTIPYQRSQSDEGYNSLIICPEINTVTTCVDPEEESGHNTSCESSITYTNSLVS